MDKKLFSLVMIFFLAFTVFTTVIVFNKPLTNLIRAKEDILPSGQTSIIIAWPLDLQADAQTPTIITVFARNQNNIPSTNKIVHLNSNLGQFEKNDILTDKEGKAVFNLVSSTPGIADITALIDNIQITQKISIRFE